jgi:hypothetical protein
MIWKFSVFNAGCILPIGSRVLSCGIDAKEFDHPGKDEYILPRRVGVRSRGLAPNHRLLGLGL